MSKSLTADRRMFPHIHPHTKKKCRNKAVKSRHGPVFKKSIRNEAKRVKPEKNYNHHHLPSYS